MKITKITLIIYYVVCLVSIIGKLFENDIVLFLSKSLIIPVIYFYYFIQSKKINILFTIALFISFIGESIISLDLSTNLYVLMIPFLATYLILFKFGLEDIVKFKFKILNVVSILIVFLLMIYVYISIVELLTNDLEEFKTSFLVYGFVLLLLSLMAAYNLIYKISIVNLYYMLFVVCIVLSDIFYVIYKYHFQSIALGFINFILQIISYYFMVQYMLGKEESKLNNDFNEHN